MLPGNSRIGDAMPEDDAATGDPRSEAGRLRWLIWVALALYIVSMVTPASVSVFSGLPDERAMGWHVAFGGLLVVHEAIEEGALWWVLMVLAAPLVNIVFLVSVGLELGAHGRVGMRRSADVLAVAGVALALFGLAALLAGMWMGNAWGPARSHLSYGVALWMGAYVVRAFAIGSE